MSFLIVMVIGAGANAYEQLDRRRRQAEHDREEAAMIDFLTGLRNRRSFFAEAEEYWESERSRPGSVGVLLIDIDHFKAINDCFGHDAGDAVLRWIGGFLPQQMGPSTMIGRMGGEEFAVLLPGLDLAAARGLAESILARLAAVDHGKIMPGLTKLTVSIGVAAGSPASARLQSLLSTADSALYRAKATGRNRAEC